MLKHLLVIAFVTFAIHWTYHIVNFMGYFRRTYNHSPGPCRKVPGIEYGSEDMQKLPSGLVLITSGIRLANTEEYNKRPGRIYLFDFNKPDEGAVEVVIKADKNYKLVSPHGINIWTDPKTGTVYVYVVSHWPEEIIDKFSFDESTRTLTHLRRISGDLNFHQVNDIVVVGEDQFYFTNYFYTNLKMECFLRLQWGSIGFFNVTSATLLQTELSIPNGINLSEDRKYLYVVHGGKEELLVYVRNDDNSIKFSHVINVNGLADNIDVDISTGNLWLGLHPLPYKAFPYLEDPTITHLPPSQVMRVKLDDKSQLVELEEVYSNDGTELPASTIAVVHGKGMLIGTVASHALYCERR